MLLILKFMYLYCFIVVFVGVLKVFAFRVYYDLGALVFFLCQFLSQMSTG